MCLFWIAFAVHQKGDVVHPDWLTPIGPVDDRFEVVADFCLNFEKG
jgi:hypothetical protein